MDNIIINHDPFGKLNEVSLRKIDHLEHIAILVESFSDDQILTYLNISYEGIVKYKNDYEAYYRDQLISLLKSNIVEPAYGTKFSLNETLVYLDLPYKSSISFKRYLHSTNIDPEHVMVMLNHLADEYRIKS